MQPSPTKGQIAFTCIFIVLMFALFLVNLWGILVKQEQVQAIVGATTAFVAIVLAGMQVFFWMSRVLKKIWLWLIIPLLLLVIITGAFYYTGNINRVDYTKLTPRELYNLAFNSREPDEASNLVNDIDNWDTTSPPPDEGCIFKNHYEFYVKNSGSVIPCFAKNIDTVDFAAQVHIQIVQGDGGGGFVLRSGGRSIDYPMYRYDINPAKQTFDFLVQHNNDSRFNPPCDDFGHDYCYENIINKTGVNTLGVIAIGSLFYLYLNGTRVSSIHNESYARGSIGLFAVNHTIPTTVRFDSFQLWYLKS